MKVVSFFCLVCMTCIYSRVLLEYIFTLYHIDLFGLSAIKLNVKRLSS